MPILARLSLCSLLTLAAGQAAAQDPFYYSKPGVKKCRENYQPIRNLAGCKRASEYFAKSHDLPYILNVGAGGEDFACIVTNVFADRRVNAMQWKSRVRLTGVTAIKARDSMVCKLVKYVQGETKAKECPAGYATITDTDVCEKAAGALGLTYNAAKNGHAYKSWAQVCYVNYLHWTTNKAQSWSTVQVNSNHYENSAFLCQINGAAASTESVVKSNFILSYAYKKFCPLGYVEIKNPAVCKKASEALVIKYDASKNGDSSYKYIPTCFATYIDNYTNKPSKWSTAQVNSGHSDQSRFICALNKQRNLPQIIIGRMGVDACPDGYRTITNANACTKAAQTLAVTYKPAYNGGSGSEAVCYVSYLDWATEKPQAGYSTVQVNSDHGESGGYICRRTVAPTRAPVPKPTRAPVPKPTRAPVPKPVVTPTQPPATSPFNAPPVTTVDPDKPDFIIQVRDEDSCPDGYHSFGAGKNMCATAAKYLGIKYLSSLKGDDDPGEPIVCFVSNIDTEGYPNKLTFESIAQINSAHYSYAGWICRSDTIVGV